MFLGGLLLSVAAAGMLVAICWRLLSAFSKVGNREEEAARAALERLKSSVYVACQTVSFCALWMCRCAMSFAVMLRNFVKDKIA